MKFASAALASVMPLLLSMPVSAQDKKEPEPATYKVEFNLRDGAQPGAARRYTMILEGKSRGTFRVGNRVPVATQSQDAGKPAVVNIQFSYVDVGVNIGCEVREAAGGQIGVRANLDISSVVPPDKATGQPAGGRPAIGQLNVNIDTLVSPGKPAVVASIDDPVGMRKFDVEVTATRMNQ
jgi:hypothetical protein